MLLRGRLPGATSFAEPGTKSKSVSWLLSRNPLTMMRLPNVASIVVVIEATLPSASTMEKWLVPTASVSPGTARRIERSPIRLALLSRYGGSEKRARRNRNEIRIADVFRAIGESEPPGFGKVMHRVGRMRRRPGKRRALEDAEDLQHGHAPRAWRRHGAHPPFAIRTAERLALERAVAGKIALGEVARLGMGSHRTDDVARNFTGVESIGAARRNEAKRVRVLRVHDARARRPCFAVLVVNIRAQVLLALEQRVKSRRHREALLGRVDRRLEQILPGQLAVAAVRQLEHAEHARHADGAAADRGLHEGHVGEAIGARGGGSGFAAVVASQRGIVLRPVQQESTAADARRFGLHQAEDHLDGDRRVERRAAAREHRMPRIDGERMRRGDNESRRRRLIRAAGDKNEKGSRSCPFQETNEELHTISGTISSATMLMILMSGFTAGPAVSL